MLRVLESVLHSHSLAVQRLEASLHHHAVRDDIEAPLLEVAHFVLRLTDDDLDDGALHPLRLAAKLLQRRTQTLPCIRIGGRCQFRLLLRDEGFDLRQF